MDAKCCVCKQVKPVFHSYVGERSRSPRWNSYQATWCKSCWENQVAEHEAQRQANQEAFKQMVAKQYGIAL